MTNASHPELAKRCTRCTQELPRAAFNARRASKDGLQPMCRDCDRAESARHQAENGAAINAARRAARAQDPSGHRERAAAYYAANRDRIRAQNVARNRVNPEPIRQRAAAWAKANPERRAEWKRLNRERIAEQAKIRGAAWKRANKDRVYAGNEARVALERGASAAQRIYRRAVWERDGGVCRLCDQPAEPAQWHLEHLIPLSRGGAHTYDNVAVAHPACNLAKGRRTLAEWRAGQPAATPRSRRRAPAADPVAVAT